MSYSMRMKVAADHNETEEMLREAMELLADISRNLAMFQRQQYHKLKSRFDRHGALSPVMKRY
jgi:hypothetical protein